MTPGWDAYDVMRYERIISGLVEDIDQEESTREFYDFLITGRKRIDRFFEVGTIEFDEFLRDFVFTGDAIASAMEFPIVDPNGNEISLSFEEVFGERIVREENMWEVLYELQTASFLDEIGLDVQLVHEGGISGPDILVPLDEHTISIECKRRRPLDISSSDLGRQLVEGIEDTIQANQESFFVRFHGERPLREEYVSPIIEAATDLLVNGGTEEIVNIDGIAFTIELVDYFEGERDIQVTKNELEQMLEFLGPNLIKQLLSPFNFRDLSKGLQIFQQFKTSAVGTTVRRTRVYDLNFPNIGSDHYEKIMNTIGRGRNALSGHPPAVLFVFLPADEIDAMSDYLVTNSNGDDLHQIDRLEQRIEGELQQSNTLNFIVTDTHYWDVEIGEMWMSHGVKLFTNSTPAIELPAEFERSLIRGSET